MIQERINDLQEHANSKCKEIIETDIDLENVWGIDIEVGKCNMRRKVLVLYTVIYNRDIPNSQRNELEYFDEEDDAKCFATCVFNALFANNVVCRINDGLLCACHYGKRYYKE